MRVAWAPLHWKIFIFAALGIFMDGYDFFIVAAALPLIQAVRGIRRRRCSDSIGAAATVGAVCRRRACSGATPTCGGVARWRC